MQSLFNRLGSKMSIKEIDLHSHLDYFPENLGDLIVELSEWFHRDLRKILGTLEYPHDGGLQLIYSMWLSWGCSLLEVFEMSLLWDVWVNGQFINDNFLSFFHNYLILWCNLIMNKFHMYETVLSIKKATRKICRYQSLCWTSWLHQI